MKWLLIVLIGLFSISQAYAKKNVLNVYSWSSEIPSFIIQQFEDETGIKVNYSSFDNNEIMFAKLRANAKGYDVVEPSSYFIGRMRTRGMLEKLDKTRLSNFKFLDPFFLNQPYDPKSEYSVPLVWGITGIFVNEDAFNKQSVSTWSDLLNKKYLDQIMLMNDARTVFATGLRMLGYSINDNDPEHIKDAYHKLKEILPNVRLFNNDAIVSLLIDEDINIGMAYNGDAYCASLSNPHVKFIYPKDGFEIWVDSFVILKNAPHRENAYVFLNFLMRPDIAKAIALTISYSTANLAARESMPPEVKNNPTLYPSKEVLARGQALTDISDEASMLFEQYWELLKMGG